ncbi:hypothetical protein [Arthrobacter sp. 18067]|nr:hypothetical protein [Arthrobacter sp. 18067]
MTAILHDKVHMADAVNARDITPEEAPADIQISSSVRVLPGL